MTCGGTSCIWRARKRRSSGNGFSSHKLYRNRSLPRKEYSEQPLTIVESLIDTYEIGQVWQNMVAPTSLAGIFAPN